MRLCFQTLKANCCTGNLESCEVCTVSSDTTKLPEIMTEGEKDLASSSACSSIFRGGQGRLGDSKANCCNRKELQISGLFAILLRRESRTKRVFTPGTGKKEPSKMQV